MIPRDQWPLPAEVPAWWADRPLTPEHLEAMREEYEREQIETARSEAAFEANSKEYSK